MLTEDGCSVCEKCGQEVLEGQWPFCPHGATKTSMIVRDEIPGGIVCENYGPHPVRFDSHSARRRYMETHGLREKEKFCPMPGTDKDPQGIPNPAGYLDAQTLANAAELICRNGQADDWDGEKAGVLTGVFSDTVASRDEMTQALHGYVYEEDK